MPGSVGRQKPAHPGKPTSENTFRRHPRRSRHGDPVRRPFATRPVSTFLSVIRRAEDPSARPSSGVRAVLTSMRPALAFRRVSIRSKIGICLVLTLSLGLHWALLQTVAWTGMLVRYSREGSLAEAIAKTFDGRHPCSLCKVVAQSKAEQRDKEKHVPWFAGSKLDPAVPGLTHTACWPPSVAPLVMIELPTPPTLTWEPPHPPPRSRA